MSTPLSHDNVNDAADAVTADAVKVVYSDDDASHFQTELETSDTVVKSVMAKFASRSRLGVAKYGTTLERTDLSTLDWVNHLQEELMDAILYIERLKHELTRVREETNRPPT